MEVDIKYYLFKKRSIFDDLKDILDLKANIGSSIIGDKSQDPPFLVTRVHVSTARRTKATTLALKSRHGGTHRPFVLFSISTMRSKV